MLDDITLVIAIDEIHIEELKFSWETWKKFKPELVGLKNKLIIYDYRIKEKIKKLDFIDNTFSLYEFKNIEKYESQRSAMLTSFFEGISQIKTDYYIKIDTDCVATNNSKEWIEVLKDREDYVFITNPWGYTRPPERLKKLDEWGDTNYFLSQFERLDLKPKNQKDIDQNKISHPRIISWFFLGNTQWTNYISNQCKNDNLYILPDPSQDTYMWYCAKRSKAPFKTFKFKKCGFNHGRINKFRHMLDEKNISKKLHLGCGHKKYDGWFNTDKKNLDMTICEDWKKYYKEGEVENILLEHVFEHLDELQRKKAIENFKKYLNSNGRIRIAVPDGFNPNKEYIENVKVGGNGKSADDHKVLFTYKTLIEEFKENGFYFELLEYYDEYGNFHYKNWSNNGGFVKRRKDMIEEIKEIS
jgi:predicted SAM-dependent methyltransferase